MVTYIKKVKIMNFMYRRLVQNRYIVELKEESF